MSIFRFSRNMSNADYFLLITPTLRAIKITSFKNPRKYSTFLGIYKIFNKLFYNNVVLSTILAL